MPIHNDIVVKRVFDAVQMAPNGTSRSDAVDLGDFAQVGNFSLQLEIRGTGTTIDVTYELSNDKQTFLTPLGAGGIVYNFWTGSGPGKDGNDIIVFDCSFARYMQVKIVEIGGGGPTITALLAVQ